MRHGHTVLVLKQHKLECSGKTQSLREPKKSKACQSTGNLWHLYSGMQKELSMLNSCLGIQQSMRTRTATRCDDCVTIRRKRPGRLLRGVIYQHDDVTLPPTHTHTQREMDTSQCSRFTGHFGIIHPIVLALSFRP
jgi:hypothetical protein